MRRLAKFIVAAVLSAAILSASTAWARDRYYRSAHPKGDNMDTEIADGGGTNTVVLVMTTTPFGPKLPTIIVVTTQAEKASSPGAIREPLTKRRVRQTRKGNTR